MKVRQEIKIKKCISISSGLVAIILMLTPYGVAMKFAPSATERITNYFSYFSLVPIGYGNWFPMITGVLSIIIFALLLIGTKSTTVRRSVLICLSLCITISMLSWIIFGTFSIVGALVMAIHIFLFLLHSLYKHNPTVWTKFLTQIIRITKTRNHIDLSFDTMK